MLFEYSTDPKIGTLKAGMTRDEVRKVINAEVYEFFKTPLCKIKTDAFHEIDVHAHYNQTSQKLEGLEIFQPNRVLYKKDVVLLAVDYYHLIRILHKANIAYTTDIYGLDLENGKLGVYCPHIEGNCPECDSVFVDLSEGGSLIIKDRN